MFEFCFNDCIPKVAREDDLVKCLSNSLWQYNYIKKKYATSIEGIITDRLPSKIILNDSHFTLEQCIHYLSREIKKIALSSFIKYPVDKYLEIENETDLIENAYIIVVNGIDYDACNAKIVEENGGILFTLCIHEDLAKNALNILDESRGIFEVSNLYGEENNTQYISNIIKNELLKKVGGFEKLIAIIGDCSYTERFKKNFEDLSSATQNFLIKEVQYSINRKALTRFYPDDKLIKDVTPDQEKEIKIYELRIFSPVAVRVYFYETPNKIYFGSIERKSKRKAQDSDILNAASVINELILLE